MGANFFCDTYALIALVEGRPEYERFRREPVVCDRDNLLELAYYLLRDVGPDRAREALEALNPETLDMEEGELWGAAALRLAERKRNLSYVDALGYTLARSRRLRFLTGDAAFRDLPDVEFVPVTKAPRR